MAFTLLQNVRIPLKVMFRNFKIRRTAIQSISLYMMVERYLIMGMARKFECEL